MESMHTSNPDNAPAGTYLIFDNYPFKLAVIQQLIEQGNHFFESLNIPRALADKVTKLYVGEELDVYYHINPQWLDFEEYFDDGADFDILAISERELKQFPNLKSIVFNMYHTPPDALISQLEESGIEVGLFA